MKYKLVPNHEQKIFIPGMLVWTVFVLSVGLATLIFGFDVRFYLAAFAVAMVTGHAMGIFHHMQLTHGSFKSKKWLTWLGSLLGTLSWRGSFTGPLKYVAVHAIHHEYADQELDPHSPKDGLGHAFMGWFWNQFHGLYKWEQYQNYVPGDLKNDPVLRFLDKYPDLLQVAYGALLFAAGYLIRDWELGVKLVLYGVFVKTFIILLAANAGDVINHTIGYRNYQTADRSTNSPLMAALHLGGAISWHNNHHAMPGYFSVRHKSWEFDGHRLMLKSLEKLGIVWDIKYHDELAQPSTRGRPSDLSSEPEPG